MVPSTRRAFLHGATGIAAVLSGCGELTTGQRGRTRTATEAAADDQPGSGSTDDVEIAFFRTDDERPPIWLGDSAGDGNGGGRPTPRADDRFVESDLIPTAEQAERVATDGVDETRVSKFLRETNFDTESVYVSMVRIEECFRLVLCDVSWAASGLSTDYGRQLRPYDEQCAVDRWVYEVRLIRIPASFSPDEPTAHSTSIGGRCRGDPVESPPKTATDVETTSGGEN